MELLLIRDTFVAAATLGKLYVNGEYECETLEDIDRHLESGGKKVYGETAIPRGTYNVILDYSQRFKRTLPHILDVPQFEGIRIHSGNSTRDTDGCILPGLLRASGNNIGSSRMAFNELFLKLKLAFYKGEQITLEIK